MSNDHRRRGSRGPWFGLGAYLSDFGDAGFEGRERGDEADARDKLYVQNAFATLSTRSEVAFAGARAGLHAGAITVALLSVLLLAILAAAFSIEAPTGGTLYGPTPVAGTMLEPLWPVLVSLVLMPFYAVVGALAALARRWENARRRAMQHYFSPIRALSDLGIFVLATAVLLLWAVWVLGLTGPQTDLIGLIMLALAFGGVLAWPVHSVWRKSYLPLIRRTGSASLTEIIDCIRAQC